MEKIRIKHDKAYDAFELQTNDMPCKLIAAVFHRENYYNRRLNIDEAEEYANLFAAAPAILEACEGLIAAIPIEMKAILGDVPQINDHCAVMVFALQAAHKAIALVKKV